MSSQLMEKFKASKKRLETKFQTLFANFSKPRSKSPMKEPKMNLEKPLSMAYQLIGDKITRFIPLFKDLDQNLQKSGLKINFKAYVSLSILASLLITLPVAVVLPVLLFFVSKFQRKCHCIPMHAPCPFALKGIRILNPALGEFGLDSFAYLSSCVGTRR